MWNFTVSLSTLGGHGAEVHSGARSPISVGFPREFGGSPEVWCPERLLAAGVCSCLMTSFHHSLQNRGGEIHTYMSWGRATLAKTREGLRITSVDVTSIIGVDGATNESAVRKATLEAQQNCSLSHSLQCPVNVKWEINDVAEIRMDRIESGDK